MLGFQTLGNLSLFMYCSGSKKFLQPIASNSRWKKLAEKILAIINAGEKALQIMNEKEKLISLQNSIAPILCEFSGPLPQKEFAISKDISGIWFDWFKVLFWTMFPEDAEIYDLRIASFAMPTRREEAEKESEKESGNEDESTEMVFRPKSAQIKSEFEKFLEEEEVVDKKEEEMETRKSIQSEAESLPNPFGDDDELSKFLDEA